MGHRKISLMKLYNRVVELGGYDWVTEEKGIFPSNMDAYGRTMEEDDYSIQITIFMYKRRIPTKNSLL